VSASVPPKWRTRRGEIEYTKALEVSKVKSDEDRAELLENAIEYDLSLKEIRAEVKKYNPAPQKAQLLSPYGECLQ
jgi:ParB family transcriptional regulator, chromosome partitioning protein